jgi:hypothetical protein
MDGVRAPAFSKMKTETDLHCHLGPKIQMHIFFTELLGLYYYSTRSWATRPLASGSSDRKGRRRPGAECNFSFPQGCLQCKESSVCEMKPGFVLKKTYAWLRLCVPGPGLRRNVPARASIECWASAPCGHAKQ